LAILITLDSIFFATSTSGYLLTMTISLVACVGYLLDVKFSVFSNGFLVGITKYPFLLVGQYLKWVS
jgi:hypothetical protein